MGVALKNELWRGRVKWTKMAGEVRHLSPDIIFIKIYKFTKNKSDIFTQLMR